MMDTITGMVSQNAKISKDQAILAIEAVLAYICHEMPGDVAEAVNTKVVNSNGGTTGGLDGDIIIKIYTEKYGSIVIAKP